ncbi:MAG: 50S ribosomal protein L20 [Parcubacteria group bacterium]|nr:50S ribosomal protein L20 [Parcubacteria group bacterium]
MARIKRGTTSNKRRKRILKHTKGFRWGRKSKYKLAKQALQKAWSYSYRDRKVKKRTNRQLWQIHINYACRKSGMSYSKFMGALIKNKIMIDRKILSQLAETQPDIFAKIVEKVKTN